MRNRNGSDLSGSDCRNNKIIDLWIPIVSAFVAVFGLASGSLISYLQIKQNEQIKEYEVTILEKQRNYAQFMRLLHSAFYSSFGRGKGTKIYYENLDEALVSLYSLEPHLAYEKTNNIEKNFAEFAELCEQVSITHPGADVDISNAVKRFEIIRSKFRNELHQGLFGK